MLPCEVGKYWLHFKDQELKLRAVTCPRARGSYMMHRTDNLCSYAQATRYEYLWNFRGS